MRVKLAVLAFFLIGMLVSFAAVQAQTTTEVKTGTVVSVEGNHVVIKMSTGEEKVFEVPDDFRLTVDGKEISVHELKPGTVLTRTITTTKAPTRVYTTMVRNGVVWHQQGNTVIITGADGKNRQFNDVPKWVTFESDGKKMSIYDLKKGMNVSATIVSESESMVTTSQPGGVSGSGPTAAAPAPARAPAPVPAEPETLPTTASNLALLALLGVGFLVFSYRLR